MRRGPIDIDLGDAVLSIDLRVKGLRRLRIVWHAGAATDTTTADRVIKPPPYAVHTGRLDVAMDLLADKKVPLSIQFTDEVGNPATAPAAFTAVYTVDDPTIIALTDNGDGTAVASAMGALGTANVHAVITFDGTEITGDLQIVVVAGLAERATVVAGPPEEVTPDV